VLLLLLLLLDEVTRSETRHNNCKVLKPIINWLKFWFTQQLDASAQPASSDALDRTACCSMATIAAHQQQHKQ
jgi:hypothetical protein